MLNLVVLLSGSSQAFKEAGYAYPKNLAEAGGMPLVQLVIEYLQPLTKTGGRLICVIQHEENRKHHTGSVIQLLQPDAIVVESHGTTSGAACSALMTVEHINNGDPLVIVNGDQILMDVDLPKAVADFQGRKLDGGVIVFEDVHPRWSFVKCNAEGLVIETAEKRPISKLATAGFYYYAKGADFVTAATEMIKKDAQVNGLFYICPAYNEMILRQSRIGIYKIPRRSYQSLASPADVRAFSAKLEPTHQPV